ncbi:hypothetical protein OK074_5666 [Actinobacteria bacterium OK074]|nr:hypothetical protein OK074_5666 [Actinobacteria bacterium OK074]
MSRGRAGGGAVAFPAVDRAIREMEGTAAGHYLHIGAVLELDTTGRPPSLDEVRTHLRRRLRLLPPLAACAPHLDDHVRELTAPDGEPAAYDALLNIAPPRPQCPWGVWLVHDSVSDRQLLCYRGHHALHDGVSLARLIRRLFGLREPAHTTAPETTAATGPTGGAALTAHVRNAAASVRLLLPAPRRPLLPGARAGRRVLSAVTVPLAQVRVAAGELGTTVLGVHLAALSYAAQRTDATGWTTARRRPHGIAVPVSLAPTDPTPYAGNRFGVALLDAAWAEQDLGRRARMLSRQLERYRDPALKWALGDALGRLDADGVCGLSERIYARCGVQTTVLPLAADLGFAGRRARRLTGLNCLPANFPYQPVLALCHDRAVCSFTADAATPGARDLAPYWQEALNRMAPPT